MRIARVFPTKTSMSPTDPLAFFGAPTLDAIAAEPDEVHISVTFSWDLAKADELFYQWEMLGVPVEVGGPAFGDRMSETFTPGMYLKEGMTITSRGCPKDCWFCDVGKCARGRVIELPVQDGWNVLDDNILATSDTHFAEVISMLKRQKRRPVFSGGLEPEYMTPWKAEQLMSVKPQTMYTAYDTMDDYEHLRHIENIPIVGLALCFATLTRKTRNARLQAMSAMAGFWAVCIFTTRKNKLPKHGTGGLTMAKGVLISIRPEWVEKIANGWKTIEVRKTKPYLETPFKCYIYCTNTRPFLVWGDVFRGDWCTEFTRLSGYGRSEADRTWDVFNGHVAGEFVCDRVETIKAATEPYGIYDVDDDFVKQIGLVNGALWDYGKGATLYCWHISGLEIYDTPKPLGKFRGLRKTKFGYAPVEIKRPPQSWRYVEELK